jgi:hypothetical protein
VTPEGAAVEGVAGDASSRVEVHLDVADLAAVARWLIESS